MSKVRPKPDDVRLPEDKTWEELSSYQRYYYENKEAEKKRTEERKQGLQSWLQEYKDTLSCSNCGEERNPCLDFHHRDGDGKKISIADMPRQGYGRETILEEIEKCDVLCANCHRVLHN